MLLRRLTVENCRSFLTTSTLKTDGQISILVGPNGGGKTNLLDAVIVMLRRHLFKTLYPVHAPTPQNENLWHFRDNETLNQMILEKYSGHESSAQVIELEVEVTARDIETMTSMKADAPALLEFSKNRYSNTHLELPARWQLGLKAGERIVFRVVNDVLETPSSAHIEFLEYLRLYELDSSLRDEFELSQLATPIMYFPVNRSSGGFNSVVELAGYDHHAHKRQFDGLYSRTGGSAVSLAIGRIAQRFRNLLEKDDGAAKNTFYADPSVLKLTRHLNELGYEWELACVNPNKNRYEIFLKKQGTKFRAAAASSGELELLTYLFAIYALNVTNALVVVDEPELHLHPTWQKVLLRLFVSLATETGNQFLIATHSPSFISPQSIQFVSRVFSKNQHSEVLRLDTSALPDAKHLLNIVNSENNERLFFADKVVLVEGVSDRIFFEALLDRHGRLIAPEKVIEVLSVHGKGLINAYARLLEACRIPYLIVADQDYVEDVGTPEVKSLFAVATTKIKKDVVDNTKSLDGSALVNAIDAAIKSGSWAEASSVWEYIKSRRSRLRGDLDPTERQIFEAFVGTMRGRGTFILKEGSLEDYLPDGHKTKDLDKLIKLLAQDDWWENLPAPRNNELAQIADLIVQGVAAGPGWPLSALFYN